jgi:hypothetical protein
VNAPNALHALSETADGELSTLRRGEFPELRLNRSNRMTPSNDRWMGP